MKRMASFVSVACGIATAIAITSAYAQSIFNHTGATDPTLEGWTHGGNGGTTGPVYNDLGSGHDAWLVNSAGLADYYSQSPTEAQVADAYSIGWRLSATVRLTAIPDLSLEGCPGFAFNVGTGDFWPVWLGAQSDGDPEVRVAETSYALEGGGSGYHTYSLQYDALAFTADFYIDGVERLSDLAPSAAPYYREVWFGNGNNAVGNANWSSVTFAIVPEPSTLGIAFGALALSAAIWHKRRAAGHVRA